MPVNTIFVTFDEYNPETFAKWLKDKAKSGNEYSYEDTDGQFNLETLICNSYENSLLAVKYLFGDSEKLKEVFADNDVKIFDLTLNRKNSENLENLDAWYLDWIAESGKNNQIGEYGQFVFLISFIQRTQKKKHLLMAVGNIFG